MDWTDASDIPNLQARDLQIWSIDLSRHSEGIENFRSLLAPDEVDRAGRILKQEDQTRFTVSRAFLRILLGRLTSTSPDKLRFSYSDKGKPALAGDETGLHFNLSHAKDIALIAVTRIGRVGVDVESAERRLSEFENIAKRFFAPEEIAALGKLPAGQKLDGFLNAWTRKEAFIKATGDGLSMPLDRFVVSLAPGDPARMISIDGSAENARGWTMIDLRPETAYTGAAAVEGDIGRLSLFRWT